MTRTLVLWCPDWPVTAAGFSADEPVAVLFANRVVACSAAARDGGVRRELRRRQAEARCPGLQLVAHDPDGEARAFEPVVAAVEAFCPRVEIVRPGVCAVATRGPSRYFGGDEALVARVTEAVADVGGQAGIADGPFAAELAARTGRVIAPGQTPSFLSSFSVDVLERPDLSDLLHRLGIRSLGAFAALPPTSVLARFGADGLQAHRLARGEDERPLAARIPPPELDVSAELDPPAERVETAVFAARGLAHQLCDELSVRGLALSCLRVEAETEHGETLVRRWRLEGATPLALAERVRWQLDGWLARANGPTAGLTLLRLAPEEVLPDEGRQLGFWGGDRALDDRAARALLHVQGLLGPEAVTTAVPNGGRGPAEQVQLVPWGDAPPTSISLLCGSSTAMPSQIRKEREVWPGRVPAPSPAVVHVNPMRAEVVDRQGQPVAVSGRGSASAEPAKVSVDGGPWADVVAWAGPWPVDERWWDPGAHRRRARWQVVTADGTAHLLAVEGGRWSVEASYD
ncbi:MAG TPA: DNA polymerase Y family protein [Acidimicrobiales bacterium]|jgi:protein ImuB|nr:DNA polymerase Y family protein [Acidimicrobiales bacterium]